MQEFTDEVFNKDVEKYEVTEQDARVFTLGSQYHAQFMQLQRYKRQGADMEELRYYAGEAEGAYTQLLNTYPDWPQLVYQLATLYLSTGRNGLAIQLLRPLCNTTNPRMEFFSNCGTAFRNENRADLAKPYFEKAVELERHPDVLANLAALWVNEGEPEKGLAYGWECIARQPDHPQGSWNLGLLLLENGEWQQGFEFYAGGFQTGERIIRSYKNSAGKEADFWEGEELDGKTIVLHGEQGIGDELLFLSFINSFNLRYPGARLVLDVHPRLIDMIQRSFPDIKDVFPTRKTTPDWNEHLPVDYKDGFGSLPKYFWKDMAKHAGYLKPNQELVEYYKDIIQKVQAEYNQVGWPVVGISWFGGKHKTRTDLRAIPLAQWEPILKNNCTFISLQYTPEAVKEVSAFLDTTGITVHHWADVTERFDYEHSLALAAATDLVVSVNTSIVHACGAMGHPCLTMTPHGHAWRYGRKQKVMPFYKSVLQFHQESGEDWTRVISEVESELKGLPSLLRLCSPIAPLGSSHE